MPDEHSDNQVLTALLAQNALLQTWLNHLLQREKRLEERERMLDEINAKRLARVEQHEDQEWVEAALLRKMATEEYEERAMRRALEAAKKDFPKHEQLVKAASS